MKEFKFIDFWLIMCGLPLFALRLFQSELAEMYGQMNYTLASFILVLLYCLLLAKVYPLKSKISRILAKQDGSRTLNKENGKIVVANPSRFDAFLEARSIVLFLSATCFLIAVWHEEIVVFWMSLGIFFLIAVLGLHLYPKPFKYIQPSISILNSAIGLYRGTNLISTISLNTIQSLEVLEFNLGLLSGIAKVNYPRKFHYLKISLKPGVEPPSWPKIGHFIKGAEVNEVHLFTDLGYIDQSLNSSDFHYIKDAIEQSL